MAAVETETMTLDEICEALGVNLKERTKLLQRIKKKYSHGIVEITEYGRKGKLKKSELIMLQAVALEFIRMTKQKREVNKRLEHKHGWLYLVKLKSLVRKSDGSYNVWCKLGETIELLERIKKYRGTDEVAQILCVLPVHDRIASENNAIAYMAGAGLVRGRREFFQVPESRLDAVVEGFFQSHILFTGNYVLQSIDTRETTSGGTL
jgi:hypothetical protein